MLDRYPFKVIGLQIWLADDYTEGFGTDEDWFPELYEYQQECANLLFFSHINPETMTVPK